MHSLTLALDGGEWSSSHPSNRNLSTHWIGGWMVPRAGLDMVPKGTILSPQWELNPDHPTVQPITSCYTE